MRRREFLRNLLAAAAGAGAIGKMARAAPALGTAPALATIPAPYPPPPRRVLYVFNVFSQRDPALIDRATAILGPSDFNVLILAFVYARYRQGKLTLSYNGLPLAEAHPPMAAALRRLRNGFSTRKRLMVSLGGWGNRATFEAIRSAGVGVFLRQLDREALTPLGIEGIDLDLEPSTVAENTAAGWHAVHDDLGPTLVALTNAYMRAHPGHAVTHAPISSVARDLYVRNGNVRGVRGSLLEATRAPGGGSNLAWLNIQFYEAGAPKDVTIPDYYRGELIVPLLGQAAKTGVARPWDFMIPGFEPRFHQTLDVCQSTLQGINRALADLPGARVGGVFLWEYRQIAAAMPAWSAGLLPGKSVDGVD